MLFILSFNLLLFLIAKLFIVDVYLHQNLIYFNFVYLDIMLSTRHCCVNTHVSRMLNMHSSNMFQNII